MDRIEHAKIEAALAVLAEARDNAKHATQQTKGVQLALRVLRGHVDDKWLKLFWETAAGDNEIGRSQSLNATYNGIERALVAGGRFPPLAGLRV